MDSELCCTWCSLWPFKSLWLKYTQCIWYRKRWVPGHKRTITHFCGLRIMNQLVWIALQQLPTDSNRSNDMIFASKLSNLSWFVVVLKATFNGSRITTSSMEFCQIFVSHFSWQWLSFQHSPSATLCLAPSTTMCLSCDPVWWSCLKKRIFEWYAVLKRDLKTMCVLEPRSPVDLTRNLAKLNRIDRCWVLSLQWVWRMSNMNTDYGFRSDSGRKLCGGLCLALFRKAQRLPCAKLNADAEGHDEEVNKALQSSLSSLWSDFVLCGHLLTSSISQIFGKLVLSRWGHRWTCAYDPRRSNDPHQLRCERQYAGLLHWAALWEADRQFLPKIIYPSPVQLDEEIWPVWTCLQWRCPIL